MLQKSRRGISTVETESCGSRISRLEPHIAKRVGEIALIFALIPFVSTQMMVLMVIMVFHLKLFDDLLRMEVVESRQEGGRDSMLQGLLNSPTERVLDEVG